MFPQEGRPRNVFEKLEDAAEVQRLTGAAPSVALHFPWDKVDAYGELRAHAHALGLRIGAVNPNLFQDPDYKLGSITNPDPAIRRRARRARRSVTISILEEPCEMCGANGRTEPPNGILDVL